MTISPDLMTPARDAVTPDTPPGYTWRPLQKADLPSLFDLRLAVGQADAQQVNGTFEDMQTQFDDPWSDPALYSLGAFTADGQAVATARTFMNPAPEAEAHCYLDVDVHPAHRGHGLEDFVLDWGEANGRQRLLAMPARHLPGQIMHGVEDKMTSDIARVERHGFTPNRYFYRMRRDIRPEVGQPIPEVALPEGLTLRTYTPDLSAAFQAAFDEAFRDHWNYEPITPDDWEMFFLKRSSFRPDLTFVVMEGNEIAAFSFNTVGPEENARNNIQEGWVAELGTRRPWRKRGLATALLCATMRAFRAEGLDYTTLGVDTQNPTGALGVYERVGFVPVKRYISFAKTIP
jgi:GNAT superfamily N-acetyltransferase